MKIKGIYLVVAVIFVAALTLSGCGPKKSKPGMDKMGRMNKPVAVTIEAATETTLKNEIVLNGKVKPIQEAEISPKISGKVSKINFEIGKRVKQGDVLFKLDDKDLRLDLQEAEASLNVTHTTLNSSLVTAETNYQDAKRDYERLKRLYDNRIGSKQDLENAESEYKLAEDTYNSAKLAEKKGTTNAKAQLEKARSAYEIAKTQLEYTVVRAPISGIVASKDLLVGQYVGSSTSVAQVVDLSSMLVETNVPEGEVNRLRIGDKVEIGIKSISNQPLTGEIMAIAPAVDSTTLNYPMKIKVSNYHNQLKSGMFATVRLVLDQARQALAVPLSAVDEELGRKYVYVLAGGKAKKRWITAGIVEGRMVQVLSGLTSRDKVIVKGQDQVKDGSIVLDVNEEVHKGDSSKYGSRSKKR